MPQNRYANDAFWAMYSHKVTIRNEGQGNSYFTTLTISFALKIRII